MKKFVKYINAEKYAMKISAERLKGIDIIKRSNGTDFIVCDNGGKDRKCHDSFVMAINNFETPFEVYSRSPKSGKHIEGFPTKELAQARQKELLGEKYRTDIQYKELCDKDYYNLRVKPFVNARDNNSRKNYRDSLINS